MAEAATPIPTEFGLARLWDEINDLGLPPYIEDLDAHGYTVVPPEIANPNSLAERMLEACLDIAERRTGERPDLERGRPKTSIDSPVGDTMKALLLEDPVFEESLMNPALLALATYLCGYDVVLSSLTSFMKGPSNTAFRLHTDTRLPSPLPTQALLCKCIYLLTDFDRDNGSTVFVPGSHKWCRNPDAHETSVGKGGNDRAVLSKRRRARWLSFTAIPGTARTVGWPQGCGSVSICSWCGPSFGPRRTS